MTCRARLQYELTQHPKLTGRLPGTLAVNLAVALESSRVALALKQDDADVLLYVKIFLLSAPFTLYVLSTLSSD